MYSIAISLQYIGIFIALAGMIYIYPKNPTKQKYLLNIILVSIIVNEVGYLFELQSTTMQAALVAIKIAYVGKMIAELGIFIFVLRYANIEIPTWIEVVLSLLHAFIIGLVWTCESNTLYYKTIDYTTEGFFPHVVLTYGIIYNLFTVVTVSYMVIILAICVMRFFQTRKYTEHMKILCLSTPPVTFMLGLYIFRTGIMQGYDTTALSYLICAIVFIYTMVRFDLVNEKEIVEEILLDEFIEAAFVLNADGKVVYANKQFEQLYGDYKSNPDIKKMIISHCESGEELEKDNKYYHVVAKELTNLDVLIGYMYVLRDVTQAHLRMQIQVELKIKEESMLRQKQQSDEMTMLLINTLSQSIEVKNEFRNGHSKKVSDYAAMIAERMGLPEEDVSKIKSAASLHDIGKLGVPDTILSKPLKLDEEEYEIIKTHSIIGSDFLENIEIVSYAADIARHHHERYDGKGYPDGLTGEEISIGARIVAVADAFDAMNSKRIYRNNLERDKVRKELADNKGLQFDPGVVDIFLEMLDSGAFDEIISDENEKQDTAKSMNDDASKIFSAVVDTMKSSSKGNSIDFLTGLLLRRYGEKRIVELMQEKPGALIFCDMDNLKTINDRFGHKSGDKALKLLGGVIAKYSESGVACRVGGDEFLMFIPGMTEETVIRMAEALAVDFAEIVSPDADINLATLSIGICLTDTYDLYSNVLSKADKALYMVKQRGKCGYHIYDEKLDSYHLDNRANINQAIESIEKAGSYEGALEVEYRQFTKMYDYINKVCDRYEHSCSVVLLTLEEKSDEGVFIDNLEQKMDYMEKAIRETIRTVDICTRYSSSQYLVLLLEAGQDNVSSIMERIFALFNELNPETDVVPRYEVKSY